MSSAKGDVHALNNTLQCEPVLMRSKCSLSGSCLMTEADDTDIKAGPIRKNSITTFEAYTSLNCDLTDGNLQTNTLIALQISVDQRTFFLCPKKPKRKQRTIKLKRKKIKFDEIFDKKDSEIEGKYRKYWFKLNCTEDGSTVYESLAFSGFFISVEGSDVLLRQCDQDIPTSRNYHIQTFPAFKNRFEVEERTLHSKALNLHREIPMIRISTETIDDEEVISDDPGYRSKHVTSPSTSTRSLKVHSVEESIDLREEISSGCNGNALQQVAHSSTTPVFPQKYASVSSVESSAIDRSVNSAAQSSAEGIPFNDDVTPTVSSPRNSAGSDTPVLGAEVMDEAELKVKDVHEKLNSRDISDLDIVVDNRGAESELAPSDNSCQPSLITNEGSSHAKGEKGDQRNKTLNNDKNKPLMDQTLRNNSGPVKDGSKRRRSFFADLFSCVGSRSKGSDT